VEAQTVTAVVDENFAAPLTLDFAGNTSTQTVSVVSGLPDGVHTVRLYKNNESNLRFRFDAFRVEPGKGLLVPEPLPARRMEIYGDSVTNSGSAAYSFQGYADLLGRELDTDFRKIAKGGTGIASAFSGQALISSFYDNLSHPDIFNANKGAKYDLSQWTPQIVVFAFGHNDQFNGGAGKPFNTKYARMKENIRAAYPGVRILSANTLISASLGHFQNATDPLTAGDPDHRFAFQPFPWNDSNTAHPPTDSHAAMVYGDERRYSMADVIEDMMGWGLDAPAATSSSPASLPTASPTRPGPRSTPGSPSIP
jgi:lysophospholipase L1-like esterase